jgi:N6-adenosine-specific RNA methylase IME4
MDAVTIIHCDPHAIEAYGALREGVHIAGYSFERACGKLEWLLDNDRWRGVGDGFDDVNAFLASIKLDNLKQPAEQRKRIAARIKELQPKASNRQIAKVLGVNRSTVDRDTGANAPRAGKKSNNSNREKTQAGANAPPALSGPAVTSGVQAAKIVERRTKGIVSTQARRADREERLGAKIAALPNAKFGVILADPEWHDEVYSEETGMDRHASRIYSTSSIDEIKQRAVESIAADDCVLFLWAANHHLDSAIEVLRAWGFNYASHYIWRKPTVGLGYWNRSVHEVLLIGTRGSPPCPALGTQWESVVDAPRGDVHSAKPEIFLEMIEAYFPHLPKIELNRRGAARPGWSAWGNEVEEAAADDA